MSSKLVLIGLLTLLTTINGQTKDKIDLPPISYSVGRTVKVSFDTRFSRGRCPERFYQVGEECLYFSIDGKAYSWNQAQPLCEQRVGEVVLYASNPNQPNMVPTKGVRQLILNTPEKSEILIAMFREYNEQNWAVRLPPDYNTLQRCHDGQDDKWPNYCDGSPSANATCFETISNPTGNICLREVECSRRYLRFVCEYTLPGSPEITSSQFRHCTKVRGRRRLLPLWVWIVIAVGGALILLIILLTVIALISKAKGSKRRQKFMPEPRRAEPIVSRPVTKRQDPAAEPMLVRTGPVNSSNSDYLEPQPSVEKTAKA